MHHAHGVGNFCLEIGEVGYDLVFDVEGFVLLLGTLPRGGEADAVPLIGKTSYVGDQEQERNTQPNAHGQKVIGRYEQSGAFHIASGLLADEGCSRGYGDGFGFAGDRNQLKKFVRFQHGQDSAQSGLGQIGDKINFRAAEMLDYFLGEVHGNALSNLLKVLVGTFLDNYMQF
jgi:hypothetical protein